MQNILPRIATLYGSVHTIDEGVAVVFDTFFPIQEGAERFIIRQFDHTKDMPEDIVGITLLQPLSRITEETDYINYFSNQVFEPFLHEGQLYVLNETYVVVQGQAPTNNQFVQNYCSISGNGAFPFTAMWDNELSRIECIALFSLPELPHLRFQQCRRMLITAKLPPSGCTTRPQVHVFIGPFSRNDN